MLHSDLSRRLGPCVFALLALMLADRVAALGGALSVDSPPGGGTRLTAELPIGTGS